MDEQSSQGESGGEGGVNVLVKLFPQTVTIKQFFPIAPIHSQMLIGVSRNCWEMWTLSALIASSWSSCISEKSFHTHDLIFQSVKMNNLTFTTWITFSILLTGRIMLWLLNSRQMRLWLHNACMSLSFTLRATPCKYRPKCGKDQKIKIALLWHTDRL